MFMMAVDRRASAAPPRACPKRIGLLLAVVLAALTLQPSAALTADAAWYRNERGVTLWSDSSAAGQPFAEIPQFLGFFRLDWPQEPVDGRVYAFYPGDTSGVQPGYAWVDVAFLAAMAPPPPGSLQRPAVGVSVHGAWLRNHANATLWSASTADARPFAVIPQFLGLFQALGFPEPRDGRVFVFYPGDTAGVEPGFGWVDLAVVGPADAPTEAGPIARPAPPRVSALPRPLPPGSGKVIRRVQTSAPLVALTLDDGIDHDALDALAERNVKLTLFLTGAWVQARPDTAQRALADGHELGNHTWGHPRLNRGYGFQGTVNEIRHANEAIAAVTGMASIPAFRPPYNEWDSSVVQAAAAEGYDVYLWDVDSGGYRRGSAPEAALATVLDRARPGSIVLMHPLAHADNAALGAVVDALRERGLEPCRLSDLVYAAEG